MRRSRFMMLQGPPTTVTFDAAAANVTISESSRRITANAGVGVGGTAHGSPSRPAGAWGVEVQAISNCGSDKAGFGISTGFTPSNAMAGAGDAIGWRSSGGVYYSGSLIATLASWGDGDILQFLVNMTTYSLIFVKNGTVLADVGIGGGRPLLPICHVMNSASMRLSDFLITPFPPTYSTW